MTRIAATTEKTAIAAAIAAHNDDINADGVAVCGFASESNEGWDVLLYASADDMDADEDEFSSGRAIGRYTVCRPVWLHDGLGIAGDAEDLEVGRAIAAAADEGGTVQADALNRILPGDWNGAYLLERALREAGLAVVRG